MKVVNNCAEQGIALLKEYNSSLREDKEQKTVSAQACGLAWETVSGRYKSYDDEADGGLMTDWSGSLLERT